MDAIIIREATPDDLEELLLFEQELITAERPMDPTIREGKLHYYPLEEWIGDPEIGLVVAEQNGKLVGSGYARARRARPYLDHEYYAYLGFMYTVPEYRGQGVNRMIIEALRGWARSRGLQELRLTVYDTNTPAMRAYEKAGFSKHILEMRMKDPL